MDRSTLRFCTALLACVAALALAACAGSPLTSAGAGTTTAAAPSAPVYQAWTTPSGQGSYAAGAAQAAALQPAPRAVGAAPVVQPVADRTVIWSQDLPPLPPPPDQSLPVWGAPAAGAPTAAPVEGPGCEPVVCPPATTTTKLVTPERTLSGCWPPCNSGISQWHARGVVGYAFSEGDDPFEECTYFGADFGRTFCGCWGLDLYYRYNTGRFIREPGNARIKDGGEWHHFGAKITFESSFGRNSRFYAWGGIGAGYFTTNKYLFDDEGFEIFGEAGLGYNLNANWRIRAGINVHGMDTDVTRRLPINDGRSRWLWILAPVIELEGSF